MRPTAPWLLLAALAISPALAQPAPAPGGALLEMQREQANPTAIPYVPLQNRDAALADITAARDVRGLLRQAQEALAARKAGQANELLERAEARLLTRSTLVELAGRPMMEGPVGRIAAARAALLQRDSLTAQRALSVAVAQLGVF